MIGAVTWAPIAYSDPQKRPGRKDFFANIDYLVQKAGIDHVGIGSDNGEGETREEYEAKGLHRLRGTIRYPKPCMLHRETPNESRVREIRTHGLNGGGGNRIA